MPGDASEVAINDKVEMKSGDDEVVAEGSDKAGNDADRSSQEDESLEVGACSLCHCALDYSDRAAFFEKDRHEDYSDVEDEDEASRSSYFYRPRDPYLPKELYDPNNALVYCDSCDRLYHQKCHFVPVFNLKKGSWDCLICTSNRKSRPKSPNGKKPKQTKRITSVEDTPIRNAGTAQMFLSPPCPDARDAELNWEVTHAHHKSILWKEELSRLVRACQGQLTRHRQAQTALLTLTSTRKNLQHFGQQTGVSQELAQTLVALYGSKFKLRELCMMLEDFRTHDDDAKWTLMLESVSNYSEDFVQRCLFPFGTTYPRRVEPRVREDEKEKERGKCVKPKKNDKNGLVLADVKTRTACIDDDSSNGSLSLDHIRCCLCHSNTATDENDLILCDGAGCFRSWHYECLKPFIEVAPIDLSSDEDFFCPLCRAVADMMMMIQSRYMGDEWEAARTKNRASAKKSDDNDDDSLKSWNDVREVFPESVWEYETAMKLRKGSFDEDTKKLLAHALGQDDLDDDFDEGDDDDEHFDLSEFERERLREREAQAVGDDQSRSTRSSQVTLVEMSSVELEIDKAELAALSSDADADDESSYASNNSNHGSPRRSRRLRSARPSKEGSRENKNSSDPGKLDESNIVSGKRNRRRVDYRKLNDAIFGNLDETAIHELDGGDDFIVVIPTKKESESDDEGGEETHVSSDDVSTDGNNSEDRETSRHRNHTVDSENEKDESKPKKVPARQQKKKNGTHLNAKSSNGRSRTRALSVRKPATSAKKPEHTGSTRAEMVSSKGKRKATAAEAVSPARKKRTTRPKETSASRSFPPPARRPTKGATKKTTPK